MPTQFTATVKPSGGDYTSLSNAVTGLANNITAADIKVFSISAYSTPTIAAGDTVLGQTSLATGVCVLVNAARTQILIKTIAVASFLSGEVVQKTADANVNVTLSNAGDSPIVGIACYSMSDTTPVLISGYTTSATNYINIHTPLSERHDGKWNNGKYRLEITSDDNAIYIDTVEYVKIIGLQIDIIISNRRAIYTNSNYTEVGYSIIRSTQIGGGWRGIDSALIIYNNVIYNFNMDNDSFGIVYSPYVYNNTIYNCYYGYSSVDITDVIKNTISYNNTVDFNGIFDDALANYNFSKDNSAPGPNSIHGTTESKTPDFVNTGAGTEDFHIQSTSDARNVGTDNPGSGLYMDDINSYTRSSPWDIGAAEYINKHNNAYII